MEFLCGISALVFIGSGVGALTNWAGWSDIDADMLFASIVSSFLFVSACGHVMQEREREEEDAVSVCNRQLTPSDIRARNNRIVDRYMRVVPMLIKHIEEEKQNVD